MELARGVVVAGKYRLERQLASGGMGSVWVARHTQLDTPAAVKFMDPQSASSAVARARFEREAKASATLRSRHVVQVLDYGVEADTPYLVMELLQGEDLSKRLHRERTIGLEAASRILTQVAKGLRPAHEAHFVHRDLKPANIFLARVPEDDEEIVKILDFGIAKDTTGAVVGESTKTGELMGSPHYMSPEQVRSARDLDARSDLWSLSVVMFRALTGRLPFNGDQIGAVIAQILADPIPVATAVAPDLPPAIDAFFAKGFARDRTQRFQNAREMAEAFASVVTAAGQTASARWTIAEEPPTRPMMASLASIEPGVVADMLGPPPRAELPSIPTEAMTSTARDLAAGPLVGTGGPVIHSAPPPPMRASPLRWLPVAGGLLGVLIGVGAFLVVRSSGTTSPATAAEAVTANAADPPLPAPTAEPSANAAAAPTAAAPAPTAAPTPTAESRAAPTAATAKPQAGPNPSAQRTPAKAPPTAPSAASPKTKPNWGF